MVIKNKALIFFAGVLFAIAVFIVAAGDIIESGYNKVTIVTTIVPIFLFFAFFIFRFISRIK